MRESASIVAVCFVVGCQLARPYPDPDGEHGVLCRDGIDNDSDHEIDCDDASCIPCVELPRIVCPDGWSEVAIEGTEHALHTCEPPETWPEDDGLECPAPPEGATRLPPGSGTITAAIAAAGTLRTYEFWLEGGRYEEPGTRVDASLILHGACDGRTVLASAAGAARPVLVEYSLALDRLRLELHTAEPLVANRQLRLDHVEVASVMEHAILALRPVGSGGGVLSISRSRVGPPIRLHGARAIVEDSRIGEVELVASSAMLSRVAYDVGVGAGPQLGIEVQGATSVLVAESLFGNGVVHGYAGPRIELRNSAIANSFLSHAPGEEEFEDGAPAPRGMAVIEDVVVAGLPIGDHPGRRSGMSLKSDLDVRRVALVGTNDGAWLLGVGPAIDLTVDEVGGSAIEPAFGIWLGCAATLDRAQVSRAPNVGVVIYDDCPHGRAADARRLFVSDVPGEACRGFACGLRAAGISLGGRSSARVTESSVERVDGCGVFVAPGGAPSLALEVTGASIGLCAPGHGDVSALAASVTVEETQEAISTDVDVCACVPPTCVRCTVPTCAACDPSP